MDRARPAVNEVDVKETKFKNRLAGLCSCGNPRDDGRNTCHTCYEYNKRHAPRRKAGISPIAPE